MSSGMNLANWEPDELPRRLDNASPLGTHASLILASESPDFFPFAQSTLGNECHSATCARNSRPQRHCAILDWGIFYSYRNALVPVPW